MVEPVHIHSQTYLSVFSVEWSFAILSSKDYVTPIEHQNQVRFSFNFFSTGSMKRSILFGKLVSEGQKTYVVVWLSSGMENQHLIHATTHFIYVSLA